MLFDNINNIILWNSQPDYPATIHQGQPCLLSPASLVPPTYPAFFQEPTSKAPHSKPCWKFSITSLFISKLGTQHLTIYTAQSAISIPCPFSVQTHRRTCPWNQIWHVYLLLAAPASLGVDRDLLMSVFRTPPLVCFCRTSYVPWVPPLLGQ